MGIMKGGLGGENGFDVSKALGLKSAASGVMRNINAYNMEEGDAKTFELKGNKLKQLIGREINLAEFQGYKYKFYSFVADIDFNVADESEIETNGQQDGGHFFISNGADKAPKINWKKFHDKWDTDPKWEFTSTEQIAEFLGLPTFDRINEEVVKDQKLEEKQQQLGDVKTLIDKVFVEKKWKLIGAEEDPMVYTTYEEILKSYLREISTSFHQKNIDKEEQKAQQQAAAKASRSEITSTDAIVISKSSWYKKYGYFPNVFLTFDQNDQPTAYYYDCNNNTTNYEAQLQKFFNVNTSDPSEAPTADNDKIPLIHIHKNANYKAIWGTLLQKKVRDKEGNEQDTGEMIDNGFKIDEQNFKDYLTPEMNKKNVLTPLEDFSKYENFLGVQSNGAPEPVPAKENDPNEIDNQKNTLAKKILWNLA